MKTIKIFLIVITAILFTMSGSLYSQTGSISGVIHDGTGSGLPGVTIILVGTTQGAITNIEGQFTFGNVAPGNYTLQVTTLSINVVVFANQNTWVYAPGAPSVNTTTVSNITVNAAQSGGNISSDNGSPVTARGVCWSTSSPPTTANDTTRNGSGTGSFTSNITGLTPNTKYYVRAYATNSVGTAYGNQISFTTCPTVTFPGTLTDQCVSSTTYALSGGTPSGGTYSGPGVTGTNFNAS
ncbi:MAG: carboxypeptidase-like regulatory domain-containing protein, partial [Bacteroidales bacterium]|nr:carboxypeptidase-like regulatory domain-containing protein [Bacteroidales bacterium]